MSFPPGDNSTAPSSLTAASSYTPSINSETYTSPSTESLPFNPSPEEESPSRRPSPIDEVTRLKIFKVTTLGSPRDHFSIFLELVPNGTGQMYQVTGNLEEDDFTYQSVPWGCPKDDPDVVWMEFLGFVHKEETHRVDEICRQVQPPVRQYLNRQKIYPRKPIRGCQTWTIEAVKILRDERIIL